MFASFFSKQSRVFESLAERSGMRKSKLSNETTAFPPAVNSVKLPNARTGTLPDTIRARCLSRMSPTPSMTMLSETADALRLYPSALTKLADGSSTGGVYQVTRNGNLDKNSLSGKKSFKQALLEGLLNDRVEVESDMRKSKSDDNLKVLTKNTFSLTDNDNNNDENEEEEEEEEEEDEGIVSTNTNTVTLKSKSIDFSKSKLRRQRESLVTLLSPTKSQRLERKRSFSASLAEKGTLQEKTLEDIREAASEEFTESSSDESVNKSSNVAIFKPADEESGYDKIESLKSSTIGSQTSSEGLQNPQRKGLLIGFGARRERGAYLLENSYRSEDPRENIFEKFLSVPTTVLAKLVTKTNGTVSVKKGSLQKYVVHIDSAAERTDLVSKVSPEEVHKVAVLDLRIFNTDRHGGNILIFEDQTEDGILKFCPIDHGLSLPDFRHLSEAFVDWQFYEQSKVPFSEDMKEFIRNLNVENDQNVLTELNLSDGAKLTNAICTLTLKVSVDYNLTAFELAQIYCRPFSPGHKNHEQYLSPLENLVQLAMQRRPQKQKSAQSESLKRNLSQVSEKDKKRLSAALKSTSLSVPKKKIWPNESLESLKTLWNNTSAFDKQLNHNTSSDLFSELKNTRNELHDLDSIFNPKYRAQQKGLENMNKANNLQKYKSEAFTFGLVVEDRLQVHDMNEDLQSKINCQFDFNSDNNIFKIEGTSLKSEKFLSPNNLERQESLLKFCEAEDEDFAKIQRDVYLPSEPEVFGKVDFDTTEFLMTLEDVLREYFQDERWKKWVV